MTFANIQDRASEDLSLLCKKFGIRTVTRLLNEIEKNGIFAKFCLDYHKEEVAKFKREYEYFSVMNTEKILNYVQSNRESISIELDPILTRIEKLISDNKINSIDLLDPLYYLKFEDCDEPSAAEIAQFFYKSISTVYNEENENRATEKDEPFAYSILLDYVNKTSHKLTIRSKNILDRLIEEKKLREMTYDELTSLSHLEDLKNCGEKSAEELQNYFHSILNTEINNISTKTEIDNTQIISYIDLYSESLSVRSKNIIKEIKRKLLKETVDIEDLTSIRFLKSLRNSGTKSSIELSTFFGKMDKLDLNKSNVTELKIFRALTNNSFVSQKELKRLKDKLQIESFSNIDLVTILNLSIPYYLNQRSLEIWHKSELEKVNRRELSKQMKVTIERIRQLSNKFLLDIEHYCEELNGILIKNKIHPKLNLNHEFIFNLDFDASNEFVSNELILRCIPFFANYVFTKTNKPFNKGGLLSNHLHSNFDLIGFQKHYNELFSKKRKEEETLPLDQTLQLFISESLKADLEFLTVVRSLVNNYHVLDIQDDRIHFRANTKLKVFDIIYKIIEEEGSPMHIDAIRDIIISSGFKKPSYSSENIRSNILRHPHLFINTSWSTYGLKKWETEKNIVGGTIKQVVEKYLLKYDSPKHIYEISNYVTKHRDTNEHNIWSNINIDPQNIFKTYEGGFVGLAKKTYDIDKTYFNKVSNHWFRKFKKDYCTDEKSLYSFEEIAQRLSNDIGVLPIQVEAVIMDRIEAKELFVDQERFLHFDQKTIGKKRQSLPEESLNILRELKNNSESNLELLTKCIELYSSLGIHIGIREAQAICDLIRTE